MDIVEDPKGELFFVDQKKPDNSSLYWATSLSRPEMGALDVSDKDSHRLISIEELPKAVRAVLATKKVFSRGSGGSMGTYLSTVIRVIDELQGILDPENPENLS